VGIPATTTIASAATTVTVGAGTIQNGDSFNVNFGGEQFSYVANERDDRASVMAGLAKAINDSGAFFARVNPDTTNIQIAQSSTAAVALGSSARTQGGVAGGGLSDLRDLSVTDFSKERGGANGNTLFSALSDTDKEVVTKRALNDALTSIESMIQTAVSGAAEFGSVQKRIEIQSDFVSELSNSLKSGIGSMIDADMEEASARLQALQVQQQLGIQALSIANQQPQSLLSLFR
jgi:flagellin